MDPREVKRGVILAMIDAVSKAKDPTNPKLQEYLMELASHLQGPHLEELTSKLSAKRT